MSFTICSGRAWQAQVKWMENTEKIKNECSMMRHKKGTSKLKGKLTNEIYNILDFELGVNAH